jgi:RNA polymerase sigma-70 factor (sigma-E family)
MARSSRSSEFEEFVAAYAEGLLRTAHLITGDAGEAEDLVQECLLRLAPRWSRIASMDQPLAYARRVLVNLAVRGSAKRTRRRSELSAPVGDHAAHPDREASFVVRDELWSALRQLTARQRVVLVLRYFHDLPEAQVAEMLGVTTGTVSGTTSRSLAQLRELIGPAPSQARSDRYE